MRYLVFFLLIASEVDGQKYNPNEAFKTKWQYCNLKGKIKKTTSKYYYNIEGDSLLKIWRTFTKDSIASGIFLSSVSSRNFDSSGTLITLQTSAYFFNNNSIEMFIDDHKMKNFKNDFTNISAPFLDSIKSKISLKNSTSDYVYNKKGKLIKIIGDSVPECFSADFNYDDNSNLIQTIFYQNKNSITEQYNYKYDKKDSLFEVEFYNYLANEYVIKKITYPNKKSWVVKWYLNDNNLYIIERNSFEEDSSFHYQFKHTKKSTYKSNFEYKVDKNGYNIYTKFYNNLGKLIQESVSAKIIINKFGKFDELVRNVKTENGDRIDKTVFEYDSFGNQLKEVVFEGDRIIYETITAYDYY
jgi:hypothetical protein